MFERFTDRARRVIRLALEVAKTSGHKYVQPVHILLGLVQEGQGVAAHVLGEFQVAESAVQRKIDELKLPSDLSSDTEPDFSEAAGKTTGYATDEMMRLDGGRVEPEHLLLGVLRDSVVATVLQGLGFEAEVIRDRTLELLGVVSEERRDKEKINEGFRQVLRIINSLSDEDRQWLIKFLRVMTGYLEKLQS